MKIVFAYPNFESLGIEYLLALCLRDGHEVSFIHYHVRDVVLGEKSEQVDYVAIAKSMLDAGANVAAFSCVSDNFRHQLRCARQLKKLNPGIITVFGGVHVTAVPEIAIGYDEVDCIAIGEADVSFPEFLSAVRNNGGTLPDSAINGIVFKRAGALVGEFKEGPLADMTDAIFPQKALVLPHVPDMKYEYRIMTSRGCPYKCSYCFNSQYHAMRGRNALRRRGVANVIDELKLAVKEFNPRYVNFLDDCFTMDRRWLSEFCQRYAAEIALPFACITSPNNINETVAAELRAAGCINIQIGVQTFSEALSREVLERMNNNQKIMQAIACLKKEKMFVQVDHMLGIPGDTIETQEQGLLLYNQCRPNCINVFWLTYYPGTSIVGKALQMGLLSARDVERIKHGYRLGEESYTLFGGDIKEPQRYYAVACMLNYLPLLPGFLAGFIIRTGIYRAFRTNNYLLSVALPRVILCIFNKKDFRGRVHLIRFYEKLFKGSKA